MSQPREENKKMIKKGHFANFFNVNISRFVYHLSFFPACYTSCNFYIIHEHSVYTKNETSMKGNFGEMKG